MRVMTMDGGFRGLGARGLGALTEAQRGSALAWFLDRINPPDAAGFDDTIDRLARAREEGLLPAADATRLLATQVALEARISAHGDALARMSSEATLASWRTVSDAIVRDVRTWVNDVRRIIGDERGGRVLRTVLLVAGAAALFGGATFVLWRGLR